MNRQFFAVKLYPPRADFMQTMKEDEKAAMQQHAAYWKSFMDKGMVHAFGPVLDPNGVYGLGIVSADSTQEIDDFLQNDPAAGITRSEYHPMMAIVAGV